MNLLLNSNNLEASRELLIQIDTIGIITLISSNCYDSLGFTQNELLNTYIYDLLGNNVDDLLSHTNIQVSITKKDGKKLVFEVASKPLFDNDFTIVGVHLSLIDISKYVNIEKKHNQLIKRFERAKDIVYEFQILPEFKFIYISPSVNDLIGYDAEANYLNPFFPFELVHPDDEEIQKSKVDKLSDFSKPFCVRFKHRNGHYVWIEDRLVPTFDDNGDLISVLGISRDVTERKKLEEKLQEQKKALELDVTAEIRANQIMEKTLKSQEELLVNISHELKIPLNVISSTAQLLDMYYKSDSLENKKDTFIKYINSIKVNSYRLSKLINNIVDTSKIEAGFFELNLSNNNIVEIVEEIVMSVTNFTEIKGLNIIFDTDTEEKIIACDPEKMERIVLNLISNAIKFSNEGGEIFVNIKDLNEWIEISVKDNGVGIEKNNLDMIFDRYKQVDKSLSRNAEGTGIGLSLVKSIV
jgi:PAS domain S-box-containing protein